MSPAGWIAICAVGPAALAMCASLAAPRGDAVRLGALLALPIALLAGGAMIVGLRRNTIVSTFVAVAGATMIRILGLGAAAYIALQVVERASWLTAFLVVAACLVAGFIVETFMAYRQLTRENPRG